MERAGRWGLAAGVGIVVVAGTLMGAWRWVESHPAWVAERTAQALGWPEGSVALEGLTLRWRRLTLEGLTLQPPQAHAPAIRIGHAEVDLPPLRPLWERQEVRLGEVVVEALEILKPDQAPPRDLELPLKAPVTLQADTVRLTDGRFHAPADGVMSEVEATGVEVEAVDFVWTPAMRRMSGVGQARIERLQLGAIPLHSVRVPELVLERTTLRLPSASVGYGESTVSVSGGIVAMDTAPAVALEVLLEQERLENAVSTALGGASPLRGFLQARVMLRSGGDLPRGGARFEGVIRLRRAEVYLGHDLKMLPKFLIDIAPWFRRGDDGWMEAGSLIGVGRFGRGWVEVAIERPSRTHRVLQAWGRLDGQVMDLVVRAVPRRDDEKPGVGVTVQGTVKAPRMKLAKRDVLLTAPDLITR